MIVFVFTGYLFGFFFGGGVRGGGWMEGGLCIVQTVTWFSRIGLNRRICKS